MGQLENPVEGFKHRDYKFTRRAMISSLVLSSLAEKTGVPQRHHHALSHPLAPPEPHPPRSLPIPRPRLAQLCVRLPRPCWALWLGIPKLPVCALHARPRGRHQRDPKPGSPKHGRWLVHRVQHLGSPRRQCVIGPGQPVFRPECHG